MNCFCWDCFKSRCECDVVINWRFDSRAITRAEYRDFCRRNRQGDYISPSRFRNHILEIESAVKLQQQNLPVEFQYTPVSDAYTAWQMEMLADYGGSRYEVELERKVSRYHAGLA